mmetsp:Transcript_35624/g.71387  ORF Transcript_35624/g.71387 Transcript_35624/m.71387 type:complete len:208 (-) Transcript_35624:180-803(-)
MHRQNPRPHRHVANRQPCGRVGERKALQGEGRDLRDLEVLPDAMAGGGRLWLLLHHSKAHKGVEAHLRRRAHGRRHHASQVHLRRLLAGGHLLEGMDNAWRVTKHCRVRSTVKQCQLLEASCLFLLELLDEIDCMAESIDSGIIAASVGCPVSLWKFGTERVQHFAINLAPTVLLSAHAPPSRLGCIIFVLDGGDGLSFGDLVTWVR